MSRLDCGSQITCTHKLPVLQQTNSLVVINYGMHGMSLFIVLYVAIEFFS